MMHQPNTPDWKGTVHAIHVAARGGDPMQPVEQVRAVAGRGLEGDRYFLASGTYSKKPGPDREMTLISLEEVESFCRETGATLEARDSRRNVITVGVPLNDLINREFRVGAALLRGIRLCEPCHHLMQTTGQKVLPGLVHRAGLR